MRIRYRLRTFLIAVMLLGVVLGLAVGRVRSYRAKQADKLLLKDLCNRSWVLTRADERAKDWHETRGPKWTEWILGQFPSLDIVDWNWPAPRRPRS